MIRTAWGLSLACTRAHGRTVEALDIAPASWASANLGPRKCSNALMQTTPSALRALQDWHIPRKL